MAEIGKEEKAGGIAIYLSFFCFSFLAVSNLINLARLNLAAFHWRQWLLFLIGTTLGAIFAAAFIKGKFSVFLHELRHAVLSNLVGNKWKSLVVGERSGHFEYAYSEKTARYNAFVALAPYWVPLFLIVGGGTSALVLQDKQSFHLTMLLSFFYGIDATLNLRDISPHQSDFTGIMGGFKFGLAYVIIVNIFIFTTLAAWISERWQGLKFLAVEPWNFLLSIYH